MRGEKTDIEKSLDQALEQIGEQTRRIMDLEQENELVRRRQAELSQQLADVLRDRDSYRIRLEHLQRSVSAVADSMNYALPGGRRS